MKKLFTSLLCTVAVSAFAQWSPATFQGESLRSTANVKNFYRLDLSQIRAQLAQAPEMGKGSNAVEVQIPTMDGRVERFRVYSFPVMAKELADKYKLGSYVGVGVDDPAKYVRFSVAPNDFQSMIIKNGKFEFVEPQNKEKTIYGVHYKTTDTDSKTGFVCSTEENPLSKKEMEHLLESGHGMLYGMNSSMKMTDQKFRRMRLAMSVTGEYTQYFGGVEGALAQINATMTRVNGVYEKEIAMHLDVQNFPELIFTDPATDPYSDASSMSSWNLQLQKTLTATIGEAAYDIGHLFGASGGGGNAGCIGCVCISPTMNASGVPTANGKGSGITSPADKKPFGDNFDIDYVAHEMGHQLGGNHTFSYKLEGTGVNVEPGSGSTIMGYAGITGATDLQPHSDPYLHTASINQIQANMIAKTCDVETPIANTPPVIAPLPEVFIPKGTAFYLTANVTDAENDPLTYSWEQMDNATVAISKTNLGTTTTGPAFRVWNPTTSPTRYFPKFATVLAGNLKDLNNWEAVPTVARTMNFQILVRDNNPDVLLQQTQIATQKVTVGNTGPFMITTAKVYVDAATSELKWDVAGTNAAPYNIANVKIDYTVDEGSTWTVLAESTPNDGSEAFDFRSIPVGRTFKVRISPIGGIFYAIGAVTSAKTPTSPPANPTPTTPANGATNIDYTKSITLSWTPATTGETVESYDIYFGTDPSTAKALNLIANVPATVTSYTVAGPFAPSTTYYWKIVPRNVVGPAQGAPVFSFTTMEQQYCTAGATSTSFEKINRVRFADIDKSSTSTAGYENFTSTVGNVKAGETYQITIDHNGSSYSTDTVIVWIDFNNDKDFDDAGEQVFKIERQIGPWTGNVTIPAGIDPVTTRMRIRLQDESSGKNLTPCGTSTYGQVEDYTLNITKTVLSALDANGKTAFTVYPNPADDVLNVTNVSAKATYMIYNLAGDLVSKGALKDGKANVANLAKGVYLISVQDNDSKFNSKFIKK